MSWSVEAPRYAPPSPDSAAKTSERELDVELWLLAVKRMGYSPVAYPLLAALIGVLTPLGSQRFGSVVAVTSITAVLAGLRIWHVRRFADKFAAAPHLHRPLFGAGVLLCGLAFSSLSCVALQAFGIASTSVICLMVLAGVVSGGTASLGADRTLARVFAVTSLGLPALCSLCVAHDVPVAVPIVLAINALFYTTLSREVAKQAAQLLQQTRILRQQHELVEAAKARAEAAVAAKAEFLATMSHELRTPLNGVIGMTELLIGTRLDATQQDYAATLKAAADGLTTLINDVLDFSQIESGELKLEQLPFDLHALMREITLMIQPRAAAKQLSFDAELAPDLEQWVIGDAGRLRQVLLNLLENAVKFTHVGNVNVRITRDPIDPAHVLFRVWDTGVGIARDKQRDVFAVFSQADSSTTRRYGGTGLGLAICERLTRAMGGEIRLESELGIGSAFYFSLRLEPGRAPTARGIRQLPTTSPLALQVLVVDDNIVNLKVAVKLLERLGCSVQTAENGQEACEKVAAGSYDAVLMDCMMPVMDGYSATRWLRANGVLIPIIAMTANNQPEDVERSKASGMNAHLAKPVKLNELAGTLRHCTLPV